ncbi:S9 family peptidase [Alicyclobacillus mengziensis]|uniref:Prolyl oligopeptidase family serine peptidase n=1 Tax=Alicyclobacillus mengziensis TaxID=2931921 RepID=A0A9X7W247_9BACL|nr:prolyl oligopeptidase family serine peptidase [Alicyclobacillus mengziensis]QSO48940.1 prolyl oligopeptidase family serine peptidase [Alicyclobacillus mengziensis]
MRHRHSHQTSPAQPVSWSPDGEWLSFTTNEQPNLINSDVYVVSKDGSQTRKVFSVSDASVEAASAWHPSGQGLLQGLLVSSDSTGVTRTRVFDLVSETVQWLGSDGVEEHPGRFSRSGEWLLTVQNVDASLRPVLYRTDTGEPRQFRTPSGLAQILAFVDNDSKLIIHQMGDPVKDADLWRDRSAVTFAHQLRAKLMMVHGLNDPRCPISQARLFKERLVAAGFREGTTSTDDFE